MWLLFLSAVVPTLLLLLFVYMKDRYELEPWKYVLRVFLAGFVFAYPLFQLESIAGRISSRLFFHTFVISGLLEESLKLAITMLLVYRSKEFNEAFDGIVYAVATSLGFAALENIFYVLPNGFATAALRALLPVSAHALFAILMGFFLGRAKFELKRSKKIQYLFLALLIPVLTHGLFDLLLLSGFRILEFFVVPFMVVLWLSAFKMMQITKEQSPFHPKNLTVSK